MFHPIINHLQGLSFDSLEEVTLLGSSTKRESRRTYLQGRLHQIKSAIKSDGKKLFAIISSNNHILQSLYTIFLFSEITYTFILILSLIYHFYIHKSSLATAQEYFYYSAPFECNSIHNTTYRILYSEYKYNTRPAEDKIPYIVILHKLMNSIMIFYHSIELGILSLKKNSPNKIFCNLDIYPKALNTDLSITPDSYYSMVISSLNTCLCAMHISVSLQKTLLEKKILSDKERYNKGLNTIEILSLVSEYIKTNTDITYLKLITKALISQDSVMLAKAQTSLKRVLYNKTSTQQEHNSLKIINSYTFSSYLIIPPLVAILIASALPKIHKRLPLSEVLTFTLIMLEKSISISSQKKYT